MVLNQSRLDELSTGGCQVPGCKHDKHGEIWIHGRCHVHASLELAYRDGLLYCVCASCLAPISQISVVGIKKSPLNTCHPLGGLYVGYKLKSGTLEIACGTCNKQLTTIEVAQ